MNPILTIMPSRGRPEECKKALDSFIATSTQSDLTILIDNDDPCLSEYRKFDEYHDYIVPAKRVTITERINEAVRLNPPYKFYHITNDDVVYHTPHWDTMFIDILDEYGHGIIYGNDLFQEHNLPTFPMISGEIVRVLGWAQMPLLNRYCGDTVWQVIGKELKCLYYDPRVLIEHMHHLAGKGKYPVDMDVYKKDQLMFIEWLRRSHIDLEKIRKVVGSVSAS